MFVERKFYSEIQFPLYNEPSQLEIFKNDIDAKIDTFEERKHDTPTSKKIVQ